MKQVDQFLHAACGNAATFGCRFSVMHAGKLDIADHIQSAKTLQKHLNVLRMQTNILYVMDLTFQAVTAHVIITYAVLENHIN